MSFVKFHVVRNGVGIVIVLNRNIISASKVNCHISFHTMDFNEIKGLSLITMASELNRGLSNMKCYNGYFHPLLF